MKKLPLSLLTLVTVTLTGCSTAVSFHEMSPAPAAAISGDWLSVQLGADTTGAVRSVRPSVKVEGNKVYISGHHTHQSVSRELSVILPPPVDVVEVFWVEPDKTTVAIPVTSVPATVTASNSRLP